MDRQPSRAWSTSTSLAPRVSAVVVASAVNANASGRTPLDLCLRSVLAEDWVDELVIVDHDNTEEVSSALRAFEADRRDVRLVVAEGNSTFFAAANLGAQRAAGRWLLFINPDVVVQRGAVTRMTAAAENVSEPWVVGGRLLDLEGRERPVARNGALNTFSSIAVAMGSDTTRVKRDTRKRAAKKVGAVSGAMMLMPRKGFNALSGFDEAFNADCADLDLCRRVAAAGGAVLFQPEAAGVQFSQNDARQVRAVHDLALFAEKSARTPFDRAFAAVAKPALIVIIALRDLIAGRPPRRR